MSLLLKMEVMIHTTIAENAEMRLLTITVSNVLPSHKWKESRFLCPLVKKLKSQIWVFDKSLKWCIKWLKISNGTRMRVSETSKPLRFQFSVISAFSDLQDCRLCRTSLSCASFAMRFLSPFRDCFWQGWVATLYMRSFHWLILSSCHLCFN